MINVSSAGIANTSGNCLLKDSHFSKCPLLPFVVLSSFDLVINSSNIDSIELKVQGIPNY